jgi:hypothetical protein
MTSIPNPQDLERLQTLTREYAKFSKSAAGWGSIIGGTIGLALYAIIQYTDPPGWARVLCGFAPILWLIAKQFAQTRYYQRLGAVREQGTMPVWLERVIQGMVIGTMLCILGASIVAWIVKPDSILSIPLPQRIVAVVVLLYGIYAARQINSVQELLAAMQMWVATLYILAGQPANPSSIWALPAYSSLLLIMGIGEHLQYKTVEGQLQKMQRSLT